MTLKELRKQSSMTAKQVADKLGVAERTVHSYESGERRISLEQVLLLALLYDCAAEEIIRAQLNQ